MTASWRYCAVLSLALALLPEPLPAAAPQALAQLREAAGLSVMENPARLISGRAAPQQLSEAALPRVIARSAAPLSASSPASPRAPNLCYSRALEELKLTAYGAVSLCSGTPFESAPLDCYRAALGANLSSLGAVLLCSGAAADSAPLECYRKSGGRGLSVLGAVTLCHAAQDPDEPLTCFEKAQESGLTAYGAIQLCGGIPVELHKQVYGDRKETLTR